MSLQFTCHQCGKKLGVDETLAGKRVRCPSCRAILAVPMVREGRLIADDTPAGLLSATAATDLDDAFLNLVLR